MSKSKLFGNKGSIFVYGQSRDSVITKLDKTGLTTADMLNELVHIYDIKLQAEGEINQLRTMLAQRLGRDEFGLRNVALTPDKLQNFISNTRVFEWFATEHPDVAGRIEAGLRERLAPPMSDAERIRKLEEHNLQLLDALKNQQNHYPSFDYLRPPHKRLRIAGPAESSGREGSDGGDDKRAEDELDDDLLFGSDSEEVVGKEGRDDTGGEASVVTSVATNNTNVVPKHRETREEGLERLNNLAKRVKKKLMDATDVEEETYRERQLAKINGWIKHLKDVGDGRDDKGGPSRRVDKGGPSAKRVDKGKRPE
ncbi:hypothetical protein HK104_006855 [Borealophlyctis nickersoniae]|nr:hypothetical protein HK104_006855 [Borealophlyctis nickersoniae]